MKFKKSKGYIIAFAETEEDIKGTGCSIGSSMGRMRFSDLKFDGITACIPALLKEVERIRAKSKFNYKCWVIIEKHEVNEEMKYEEYTELKDIDDTRSVGDFDTEEEARDRMNWLGDNYQEDNRSEENKI